MSQFRTLALLAGTLLFVGLVAACGGGGDKKAERQPLADFLETVVQVAVGIGTGDDFEPVVQGSGTIIDARGFILTSFHVVDPAEPYDSIAIGVAVDANKPPRRSYAAGIAAFDAAFDVAVLKVIADAHGNPLSPTDLPAAVIGDSDSVEVGDTLRIAGYPDIGGETVTVTEGIVSGFESDPTRPTRRLRIKTDAEISSGSSGGGAFNDQDALVAIPTALRTGGLVPTALGQLLPVALATDLLAEARRASPDEYITSSRDADSTDEPTEAGQRGPAPFDSFHYTVDLGFTVTEPGQEEEAFISGQVEGDFVAPDSHAFSNSFTFGGLSGTDEVVIIGNDAWIKEAGGDWRKTTRGDSAVGSAIDLTSADPDFLQDPEIGDALAALDSEPETINGVDTRRYHIPKSALPALTSILGEDFLQDVSGLQEFEMTVWLEEETGALVRADLTATATPQLLGQDAPFDISPDATLTVTMLIDLTQINDSSISIDPPI